MYWLPWGFGRRLLRTTAASERFDIDPNPKAVTTTSDKEASDHGISMGLEILSTNGTTFRQKCRRAIGRDFSRDCRHTDVFMDGQDTPSTHLTASFVPFWEKGLKKQKKCACPPWTETNRHERACWIETTVKYEQKAHAWWLTRWNNKHQNGGEKAATKV